MNLSNSILSKNSNEKLSFENKANLNFLYKNNSDNTLPYVFCNQFNKSLITGISQMSEVSTKNSSGLKEKKQKIKKRIGINIFEKLKSENLDNIVSKKIKAFEALEKLLINDNVNNENEKQIDKPEIKNDSKKEKDKKNSTVVGKTHTTNNNSIIKKKRIKKSLSIPKLDFSNIFNQNYNVPFCIQEVKYISQFSNEDSNTFDSNSEKKEIKNNNHQHKNYKKSKNKRN